MLWFVAGQGKRPQAHKRRIFYSAGNKSVQRYWPGGSYADWVAISRFGRFGRFAASGTAPRRNGCNKSVGLTLGISIPILIFNLCTLYFLCTIADAPSLHAARAKNHARREPGWYGRIA